MNAAVRRATDAASSARPEWRAHGGPAGLGRSLVWQRAHCGTCTHVCMHAQCKRPRGGLGASSDRYHAHALVSPRCHRAVCVYVRVRRAHKAGMAALHTKALCACCGCYIDGQAGCGSHTYVIRIYGPRVAQAARGVDEPGTCEANMQVAKPNAAQTGGKVGQAQHRAHSRFRVPKWACVHTAGAAGLRCPRGGRHPRGRGRRGGPVGGHIQPPAAPPAPASTHRVTINNHNGQTGQAKSRGSSHARWRRRNFVRDCVCIGRRAMMAPSGVDTTGS